MSGFWWDTLAAVRRLIDECRPGAFPRLDRLERYLVARLGRGNGTGAGSGPDSHIGCPGRTTGPRT